MSELRVYLPPEMEPYRGDLEFFVAIMVRKLHLNRHKGVDANLNPGRMLVLAEGEFNEAVHAWMKDSQFDLSVECADLANMAFLAARGAWQMTREEYKEAQNGGS